MNKMTNSEICTILSFEKNKNKKSNKHSKLNLTYYFKNKIDYNKTILLTKSFKFKCRKNEKKKMLHAKLFYS